MHQKKKWTRWWKNLTKRMLPVHLQDLIMHRVTKRKSFSRRRAHMEESYVNYVNDRNKQFNQKISKAFDKYTVEIRQNLERGTAV